MSEHDRDRFFIASGFPEVSGERPKIPTMGELAEKIDAVAKAQEAIVGVVQSQSETQLEIYEAVKAMQDDMRKMRGEYLARIPPGYRWALILVLASISAGVWEL